jgi:hypothetical protein
MNNKILILAPISVGEYFDKLSILRIKESKIADPAANHNIKNEIEKLTKTEGTQYLDQDNQLDDYYNELFEINLKLWALEEEIRDGLAEDINGEKFINASVSLIINNEKRAEIKRKINEELSSDIIEEKFYIKSK